MKHILLLHGAIGSSEQLQLLKNKLEGNFRVHTPDFPGHGGDSFAGEFSIPFFARRIQDYCSQNHIRSVSIFGYSMGGYVAMYLARMLPGLVEKLITLATKFQWDREIAEREIKMLQPEIIENKLPQFALALSKRHAPANWKEVLFRTAGMVKSLGNDNALKPDDFAELNVPCLLMLGDRDKMVTLEETLAVYKCLPQAQLCILPATPHPVEAADPDLLTYMIKHFISDES